MYFKISDILLVEEYLRIYFICTAKFLTLTKLIHFESDRKSPTNVPIRQLDDHRILLKLFKNFDQNSGGQPQYPIIQMTFEFLEELDDHGILVKFFKDQMISRNR